MSRRMTLLAAVLLVLATSGPTVQAQNPPPLISAQIEVSVINVDVTVTDAHGRPVPGLKKEDFEIFEDGKPQKVTNFDIVERAVPVRSATQGNTVLPERSQPARITRHFVLLVDNNYIDKVQRDAALKTIGDFVNETVTQDSEWAIGSIGQRVEMIQPFTTQKNLIHNALAELKAKPTFSQRSEMNREILSDGERRRDMSSSIDGISVNLSANNFKSSVRFQAREQTWRALHAITNTARAVSEISRTYSATEGRKVMVLLTGGIESNTTFAAFDTGFDREIQQLKLKISTTIDDMVHEANSANFTIDVVNARVRGMIAPQHDVTNRSSGIGPNVWKTGGGNEPIDITDLDSASLTVTGGTGGFYLTSNVIRESLDKIDMQTSNYYSLGYSPDAPDNYRYHRIAVKVKRPGVHVAHRKGYIDLTREDRIEQVLRARLAVQQPMGSLPVALKVGEKMSKNDRFAVPVTAALPLQNVTLVPFDGQYVGRVHVYISVFDENGNNIGFSHKVQDIKLTAEEYGQAGEFKYTARVRLDKGTFKVLVTLRDDLSNEIGSAVTGVLVSENQGYVDPDPQWVFLRGLMDAVQI